MNMSWTTRVQRTGVDGGGDDGSCSIAHALCAPLCAAHKHTRRLRPGRKFNPSLDHQQRVFGEEYSEREQLAVDKQVGTQPQQQHRTWGHRPCGVS